VIQNGHFGNYQPGLIRGLKWHDRDGDGGGDGGEEILPDWTIYIDADDNGQLDQGERSTTTLSNGWYCFAGLEPGTYILREVLQQGWAQSYPEQGYHEVTVASGDVIQNLHFGNYHPGLIRGLKWHDRDGDAHWQYGEPFLAGWTIYLDTNGNSILDQGESSTVTAANGTYAFTGLRPARYTVREVLQQGWQQTYPSNEYHDLTLRSGTVFTHGYFGNTQTLLGGDAAGGLSAQRPLVGDIERLSLLEENFISKIMAGASAGAVTSTFEPENPVEAALEAAGV